MSEVKEAILKMVEISNLVTKNGLENSRLEKSSVDNKKYHDQIIPQIASFKQQYAGASPQKFLEKALQNFIENINVTENYEAKGFHYFGRLLHSYCWAAITVKDPTISQLKVTYCPQLYILVNSYGIRFGFTYGNNVKPNSKFVEIVESNQKLGNQILKFMSATNLKLYSEIGPEKEPNNDTILTIKQRSDLETKWSNKVSLIADYPKPSIPDEIENIIGNTFQSFFYIFDTLSRDVPIRAFVQQSAEPELIELLNCKKQIILYGPPGTGKTFKAQKYAVDFLSRRLNKEVGKEEK